MNNAMKEREIARAIGEAMIDVCGVSETKVKER